MAESLESSKHSQGKIKSPENHQNYQSMLSVCEENGNHFPQDMNHPTKKRNALLSMFAVAVFVLSLMVSLYKVSFREIVTNPVLGNFLNFEETEVTTADGTNTFCVLVENSCEKRVSVELPATTKDELIHFICVEGAENAYGSSTQSSLTYTPEIDPSEGTNVWDDRDYGLYEIEGTPCSGGILLKPSLSRDISIGTVITIEIVGDPLYNERVCVFVIKSGTKTDGGIPETSPYNGGLPETLPENGFGVYPTEIFTTGPLPDGTSNYWHYYDMFCYSV